MPKTETLAPTPERLRHAEPIIVAGKEVRIVEVPTDRAGVVAHQVAAPHMLDRYFARGELAPGDEPENRRRYEAGCMLRLEWEESGAEAVVVGSYETAVDGFRDPENRIVRGLDGLRTWRRYIQAIGPECSWYCILACCAGLPVGKGVSMLRLRNGLARLADETGV